MAIYLDKGLNRIAYDKSKDNYRAIFSNDVVLNEFERIFEIVEAIPTGFTVTDLLIEYDKYDNPLKHEKLFTHKNLKTFISTYISHNNLPITYSQRDRKWVNDSFNIGF